MKKVVHCVGTLIIVAMAHAVAPQHSSWMQLDQTKEKGSSDQVDLVNFLSRRASVALPYTRSKNRLSLEGAGVSDQEATAPITNGVAVAGDDSSSSSVLAAATGVSCHSGYMTVSVHKDSMISKFGSLKGDQLSFRDTDDPSCRSTSRGSNQTHFVLATLNSHCATSLVTYKDNDGSQMQLIQNQVIFRPGSNYSDTTRPLCTVNITCTVNLTAAESRREEEELKPAAPSSFTRDQDYGTSNHSFRLTLSDRPWNGSDAHTSWVKHPFKVPVGSRIYAQIQIVQPNDEDLKAFAKECFYSMYSDPLREPKAKVITSGCAASGSVNLHSPKPAPQNRYTRLSFQVERIYFESNYMYFQCKVVACSLRGGRETEGYETCPNSTMCSDRTIDSRYVPFESPYSYVSSGLLRPILEPDPVQSGKEATCPPCSTDPTTQSPPAPEPQQAPEIILNGVPVSIVVGIGFGFFGLGFMMMGGIWWVRVHTDPKRILQLGYNGDHDSSSFLPVPPTPDSYAPVSKNCLREETVPIRTHNA